jgi:hypothetical protein
MNGAAKFGLGILLIWLSMVAFFFAFHPNGVILNGEQVKNPVEALQWLIQEFQKITGGGQNAQPAS